MTVSLKRPVSAQPPARVPLLRRRVFRRLWLGETTSSFGSSVTSVALPLVALTLHADVFAVAVLTGVAWVPWVVIGLPAGAWVDRLPRRPVMMSCDIVSLLAFLSVPVAGWLGVLTVVQLFAVAVVAGVAEVFFATAYRTLVPAVLPVEDLVAGNAQLQGAESAARVAGPGVAGLLAQAVGATSGLLVDAVSFAVSLACLRGLRVPEEPVAAGRRSLRAEIGEGLHFLLHDRLLRTLMVWGGFANLVLSGYGAITVVFLVRGLGLGFGAAGVLIAVGQAGGVAGALLAPRLSRTFGSARTLIAVKLVTTPAALLIPLAAPDWRLALFVVGDVALVAGVVGGNVVQRGFTQAYCPLALMGRVNTSTQVVNFGAIPVGAVLGGVLASAVGFRPALVVLLGGFVVVSVLLLLAPELRRRDLPAHPRADPV